MSCTGEDRLDEGPGAAPMPDLCLPDILGHIAKFLPPNDVVLGLKLVNKTTADHFRDEHIVNLSEPSLHDDFCKRWCRPGAMQSLARRQREELLELTAASGRLDNLQAAISAAGLLLSAPALLPAAARAGHLHVCKWLHQRGLSVRGSLPAAAEGGHRAVCEWLLDMEDHDDAAPWSAAKGGHVELMDWLLERLGVSPPQDGEDLPDFTGTMAECCDLPTLQRLCERWPQALKGSAPDAWLIILRYAADSRTPDWRAKFEWLEGVAVSVGRQQLKQLRRDPGVCAFAALWRDAVDRITWLRQRGYPVNGDAIEFAAEADDENATEVLSYLVELLAWDRVRDQDKDHYINTLAHAGALDALQWVHRRGFIRDPQTCCANAVKRGRLAVVMWLVETFGDAAIVLNAEMSTAAVKSGSMELLAWLHERGCERSSSAFVVAADGGCEEVLTWLAEQGWPMPAGGEPYWKAVCTGDLATLACLRRLGCPWGADAAAFTRCLEAVLRDCFRPRACTPTLRWLLDAGCPVDWDGALKIADCCACRDLGAWVRQEWQWRRVCTVYAPQ